MVSEAINDFIKRLELSISQDNIIDVAYEITEDLQERPDAFLAVGPILKILEANPDVDFGTPGPLVHFVEKFYKQGYEELLVDSIKRCPTELTIWMLNRIINGSKGEQKAYFLQILKNVTTISTVNEGIKALSYQFISSHEGT